MGQSHLYVAEGPETSLSISEAAPDTCVIAPLSVSNYNPLHLFSGFSFSAIFSTDEWVTLKQELKALTPEHEMNAGVMNK